MSDENTTAAPIEAPVEQPSEVSKPESDAPENPSDVPVSGSEGEANQSNG